MFTQKTTTIRTYHFKNSDFKKMRDIYCKWTLNPHDNVKNELTAAQLFEMRSEFFRAITAHIDANRIAVDTSHKSGDAENAVRVIQALLEKTEELEKDFEEFDTLTDYDGAM